MILLTVLLGDLSVSEREVQQPHDEGWDALHLLHQLSDDLHLLAGQVQPAHQTELLQSCSDHLLVIYDSQDQKEIKGGILT